MPTVPAIVPDPNVTFCICIVTLALSPVANNLMLPLTISASKSATSANTSDLTTSYSVTNGGVVPSCSTVILLVLYLELTLSTAATT